MILYFRNIFTAVAFGCGLVCIGAIALLLLKSEEYLPDLLVLSSAFTVITIVSILIFFKGSLKPPRKSFWYTLVSMGVKLLLEMVLIFLWFVIAKKSNVGLIFTFFVLYLAFTLFLILTILKTLNNKSLQKKEI